MKVLITSQGESVESLADQRFGRAAYFVIFDDTADKPKVIENPGLNAHQGAGVAAAQTVNKEDVDVVITGHLGPNASRSLQAAGISVYRLPGPVSIKAAYEAFLAQQLESLLGS